jgi:PEP-CTERM motif
LRRDVTLTSALVYFKNTKGDVQGLLRKRGGGNDIELTFKGTPKGEAGWKTATIDNAAAQKGDWLLLVFADNLETTPVSFTRFDLPTGAPRPLAGEQLRVYPGDFTKVARGAGFQLQGTIAGAPPGVPEPGTWALLVSGFGLSGVLMRRHRALSAKLRGSGHDAWADEPQN